MKPASEDPRPRSKSAPSATAATTVARASGLRPRFGPEPSPQPATGARLRHLEARRNRRSGARLRWAKPGPATQPPIVFRRILRRPAASIADLLPVKPAAKGTPVAAVAAPRPRAPRRAALVPGTAPAASPETVPPAAAPLASDPAGPQSASAPSGAPSKSAVLSVSALPALPDLIGAKPTRSRGVLPPLPAILLEGDLPAPRALSPSAQVPPVATSAAAPVPADLPSTPNMTVLGEGRSGGAGVAMPAVPMWSTPPSSNADAGSGPTLAPDYSPKPVPSLARRPDGSVWLTPRDPRTFLACWTFPGSVLDSFRAHAGGGNWSWRLRRLTGDGPVVASGPLPANEGFVFIEVALPGVRHVLELGLDHGGGGWTSLAFSTPENTPGFPAAGFRPSPPAGAFPPPTHAVFVPESGAVPSGGSAAPVQGASNAPGWSVSEEVLEEVLQGVRAAAPAAGSSELGPDIPGSTTRRVRVGVPAFGASTVPFDVNAESSDAVPTPPPSAPEGFWMRVNAEVVLHGSTEPDAQVSIAGRPVRLRPDGSFTFRFSLPDGDFTLPVVAVSGSGVDARAAEVRFVRQTRLSGAVGVHPIDPALKPPRVESLP